MTKAELQSLLDYEQSRNQHLQTENHNLRDKIRMYEQFMSLATLMAAGGARRNYWSGS